MARPSVLILLSLVLSILLLVPCQARSGSMPKTVNGLPLLEKEEVAVEKEEEARRRRSTDCDGWWIHIRDLPPWFNTDLLQSCDAFPLYDDGNFCPYLSNHGLGPRTHNRSRSWYRTDTHMLERFFHRRLLEYPCLTPDSARADAIFLPYYAALDVLPFLYDPPLFNSSALHDRDLANFLRRDRPTIWDRHSGYDHFLVLARPAWDVSQEPDAKPPLWGTSFLRLPDFNITVLSLEARPWPWQEHAVPHPTSFHPATLHRCLRPFLHQHHLEAHAGDHDGRIHLPNSSSR